LHSLKDIIDEPAMNYFEIRIKVKEFSSQLTIHYRQSIVFISSNLFKLVFHRSKVCKIETRNRSIICEKIEKVALDAIIRGLVIALIIRKSNTRLLKSNLMKYRTVILKNNMQNLIYA
jgi:hypothetical protein